MLNRINRFVRVQWVLADDWAMIVKVSCDPGRGWIPECGCESSQKGESVPIHVLCVSVCVFFICTYVC